MKKLLLISVLVFASSIIMAKEIKTIQQVSVDFSVIIKTNAQGASGANLCWLLDSDKFRPRPRSMKSALTDLGVGALRFPYGHLGDNYLWTTPPYENAINGLTARVATKTSIPGKWDWCVNADGTFKNALDFDEYIQLCKSIGAEPLIMVNVLSFKYANGPSLETLLQSAAEWVKYANVTRKYGVKYWQLGNEVEHTKELTKEEYVDVFGKMATAMKSVDSTIHIGTGVLGNVQWNKQILETYPHLVSFISAHQYAFNQKFAETGYEGWKELTELPIKNVRGMQNLLDSKPEYKDLKIMITETGATGGKWPDGRTNDLYKSLYWFEMNMEEISLPNVKYSFFWGTHSPWNGENGDTGLEYLLTNKENNTTPTGKIVELINKYLPVNIVKTQIVSGYLRTYAGINPDKNEVAVFVLNKNDKAESCNLNLSGIDMSEYKCEKIEFAGKSATDTNPQTTISKTVWKQKKKLNLTLAPISLTIFKFKRK